MSTRPSIGLYLRHSILATALVVGLPLAIAAVVVLSFRTTSALVAGVVVATLMAATVARLGSLWWRRRPESVDLCFSELMLWGFWRRRQAELRLEEGVRILGLDRRGRPLRRAQISKADRVKILHDLTAALEAKDPYTHGHSTRVEHLATKTAQRLGLKGDDVETLKLAASLHDVGKIRVPSRVLRKPGLLTEEERSIVQEHSVVGAWMVSRGVQNPVVVESIRHHHERWDGRGYPDGLEGRTIPMFARIIAVADAYDAMTSTRPYRPSLDRSEALQELRVEAGNQFDPIVVDAFIELEARRSPVAGFLAFGGFYKLLRRAFSWSARTTSTGVGPVVGAVGASSLLIAGMMGAPAGSPRVVSQEPVPSQEVQSLETGTDPGSLNKLESADKALLKRGNFESLAAASEGAEARDKDGDRTSGAKDERRDDGDSNDGDKPSKGPDRNDNEPKDPAPTVEPEKPDKPEKPDPPEPSPSPPPDTGKVKDKVKSARTDPNPDKGRDCIDHPGKGQGGGNAKHCGSEAT